MTTNDGKLIDKFCKENDGRILQKLSLPSKALVRRVCSKAVKDPRKYQALASIAVIGIDHRIPNRVDLIFGARTLTVHKSQKYNKYIYLFGEHHYVKRGNCK